MDNTTPTLIEARQRRVGPGACCLAVVLVLCAALLASSASAVGARHAVSGRWSVGFTSDVLAPDGPEFVETWVWRGAPFGRSRVVTRTPRDQANDLIRTPSFSGRTAKGSYRGHLGVKKTYLGTTSTHSLARIDGTGRFEGGTGAYRGARGRITRVHGDIDCFADGCEGHLTLKGWITW